MAPRSGIAWRRWVEDKKCAVIVQVTDGPVQLSAYQFVGVGEPECNPVHCRLEGSVDGQSWSKLHSQSMRLGAGEARRFPVSCRTAYSYFRFKLTRAVERLADDEWVARSQARKAAIIETGVEETKDSESQSLHKLTDALATITASAENVAGGEVAANLLDGKMTTKWLAFNHGQRCWLKFSVHSGVAFRVTQYSLTSGNDFPQRDPSIWTLLGSMNDSDWQQLDVQSGAHFHDRRQRNTFMVPKEHQDWFRYYQLVISANSGAPDCVQLTALYLQGDMEDISKAPELTEAAVMVNASGQNSEAGDGAVNVVREQTGAKWVDFGAASGRAWLSVHTRDGAPYRVSQYALVSAEDHPERDPADWSLQGSNDGEDWTELDSQSNVQFTDRGQQLTFVIADALIGAYPHYRLQITGTRDAADAVQLARLRLFA